MKFLPKLSASVAALALLAGGAAGEPTAGSAPSAGRTQPAVTAPPQPDSASAARGKCPVGTHPVQATDGTVQCIGTTAEGKTFSCPLLASGDPLKGLNVSKPGHGKGNVECTEVGN